MAYGPEVLQPYKGFREMPLRKQQAYVSRDFERQIDASLMHERFILLSYFSTSTLDFEWPIVEATVREGNICYCIEFEFEDFDEIFDRQHRNEIYKFLRMKYQKKGWTNVYFEYTDGFMNICMVRRD